MPQHFSSICLSILFFGMCCQAVQAEKDILEKAEKYRLSGEYRLALEEAEKLLAGPDRDNGDVHYFYAFMLYRLKGDTAKVKLHLQEGLRIFPYSWSADDARRLLARIEKTEKENLEIAGLPGARVGINLGDGANVDSVEDNSPAAKVGIVPGDKIVFVDNVSTSYMSTKSVAVRLAGPAGSRVNVTVLRNGARFTYPLTRVAATKAVKSITTLPQKPQVISPSTKTRPSAPIDLKEQSGLPIEIFRRTQKTVEIEKLVKQAIGYVPVAAKESIRQGGISVLIVPDMLTADPQLANQKPRGYTFGGYDNCGGFFKPNEKKIYIAERFSIGNSPLQDSPFVLWTILHELGHAFDSVEHCSGAESFTHAYEDDAKYLDNELRIKYSYFLEFNMGGHSEMFAELFSAVVAPNEDLRAVGLSKAFPRCTKVVRDLVGK